MTITKARAVRRRRGSIIEVPGARGVSYKLKFDMPSETGERRTYYKTIRGNREDAEAELAKLAGKATKGADLIAGKQPLSDWIEEWLSDLSDTVELPDEGISQRTYERYAELLRGHVVPQLGDYPLAVLKERQIERFYIKHAKAGLARRTIKQVQSD